MKLKKKIAVLLTATMVLGMTVTAFADSNVPGGGSATGAGGSEGHLDREIGNVVLPTTVSANAFDYKIDPERLVNETSGAIYETGTNFTNDAKSKGVYFLTSAKNYDYKTNSYDVENKSTFPIDVTVEVAVPEKGANDIALVSENGIADAQAAKTPALFLGLNLGGAAKSEPVLYGTSAKKTVSVNTVPGNFHATVSTNSTTGKKEYKYEEVASPSAWQKTSFYIEGLTTNGASGAEGLQITKDTTAPNLTVTWKWKKYGAASGYLASSEITSSNPTVNMTLPEGVSVTSVTLYKASALTTPVSLSQTQHYTKTATSITFKGDQLAAWGTGSKITIKFSDNKTEDLTVK